MKRKINLITVFLSCILLASCGPEQPPPPNIHKLVTDLGTVGITYVCCYGSGEDCSKVSYDVFMPLGFREFVENNEIGTFFKTRNWQDLFPELIGNDDIIRRIIDENPKGVFVGSGEEESLIILKDSTAPLTNENVLIALVGRLSATPCPGYPG